MLATSAVLGRSGRVSWTTPGRNTRNWTVQAREFGTGSGPRPSRMIQFGVSLGSAAKFAAVELRRFTMDNFHTDSLFGRYVWSKATTNPLADLEAFGKAGQQNATSLLSMIRAAIKVGGSLTGNGLTEYVETDKGHQYGFVSAGIEVPESLVATMADVTSPQPFLDMHGCFPPYGTLLPTLPDGGGDRDQQAVVAYVKKRLAEGGGPLGLAALGDSSTIQFSDYLAAQLEDLTVRAVWANTTDDHVFDGRVLWMLVYCATTRRAHFIGLGAGLHQMSIMDGFNTVMGGVVFSTMLRTYRHWLRLKAQSSTPLTLTDGLGWDSPTRLTLMEEVSKAEPELESLRAAISVLDFFGQFAADLRGFLGPQVIGPPSSGAVVEVGSDLKDPPAKQ